MSFMVFTAHQIYIYICVCVSLDKEDEMGGACGT